MASPTTRLTAELLPQAAATQDVTLPTIASGATLASPTVAPGAIGITMPAISSGATVFAPTVAPGAVAVILPTISSGATLAAPTVAPGAVAVALPFISSGATLYAPTVIPPAQAIILHGAPIEWVANPDFEVDDADWSADAGVTIMRTTSESHGGTASLEIVIAAEDDDMVIHVTKTLAFTGAAGEGAIGDSQFFSVTGIVGLVAFAAQCTEDLVSAGGGNFEIFGDQTDSTGTGFFPTSFMGDPKIAEDFDAPQAFSGENNNADFVLTDAGGGIYATVDTGDITDGTIVMDVLYRAITSDGALTPA